MIRTVLKPDQRGGWWFAYVYADDKFVLAGPPRRTPEEAVAEALRFFNEGRICRDGWRAEQQVSYGSVNDDRREARTVSSMIAGRSAAAFWGGR